MKKIIFGVLSLLGLSACNDGDLTIESISFEGTQLSSCVPSIATTFLYKTQSNQALILSFPSGTLTHQEGNVTGSIPTDYRLTYRAFSEVPNSANFCTLPPPSTPSITTEIEAKGGSVEITTKQITDPNTGEIKYNHLITIKDLVITNDKGEKLIESNVNFGVFQTNN